jgi:DNA-binding NarL/FixJ family response regulator
MQHTIQLFIVGEPDEQLHELKKMLADQPDIVVTGEIADLIHLSGTLSDTPTEVVLMSLQDAESGMRSLSHAYAQHPLLPILVLSEINEAETIAGFFQSGARGHLHRSEMGAQGLRALRHLKMGEVWAPRRVLELFAHKIFAANGKTSSEAAPAKKLTEREMEIFRLLNSGISNKEIARSLSISDKTVKTHLQNIFRKLHIHRRQQVGTH